MNLLFWLLWTANLLLVVFLVLATNFRSEMNLSTGLNYLLLLLALVAAIASMVLYFSGKHSFGLWLVSAPLLFLLGWWLVEKVLGMG